VRKIDTNHIQTGQNHLAQNFLAAAGRAKRGNDFGSLFGAGIGYLYRQFCLLAGA
jgi:hypothetical protein